MKLFDQSKNKKQKGDVLPSFILLKDMALDIDLFIKNFYDDWGIELPVSAKEEEHKDELPMLVTEINNMTIAVSLMPAPVPNDEAVDNAKTNLFWPEAVEVAENHQAHILVVVIPLGEQSLLEVATLHTKLCVTCLKQPNAVAVNAVGTVFEPQWYIESALIAFENNIFPIMNLVYFGVYSNDNGETVSGYTFGLEILGKKEIEILDSAHSFKEIFDFLTNIVSYIIGDDVTLQHGETIGFYADQKLSITESAGVAVDGETLKIGF